MAKRSGTIDIATSAKLDAIVGYMQTHADFWPKEEPAFDVWVSASPIADIAALLRAKPHSIHKYLNLLEATGRAKRLAGNHAWALLPNPPVAPLDGQPAETIEADER